MIVNGTRRTLRRLLLISSVLGLILLVSSGTPANAQDVYIGEIDLVPYTFAMKGFADCNGQLLLISQNTALFSLLGTTYGGDGKSTFALPDLRDRVPIHAGQGPGLSRYAQGQAGGESGHTLTVAEMPSHTHTVNATGADGTFGSPAGNVYARNGAGFPSFSGTADTTMSSAAVRPTGAGQPHNNLQPYLGLKYVIALQGIFPSRP